MKTRLDLIQYLRDRILGELHVGRFRSGDRLPGIRDVARQTGKNTRTVAAAYRALETEGLVEVRGRSGVFVAQQEVFAEGVSQELVRWLSGVIAESWKRRLSPSDLLQLVQRCTKTATLRCGFVELVEDAVVAFTEELVDDWGFDVRTVTPASVIGGQDDFADIDFFAATSFYAPAIHDAVRQLGKPLIVLTVHDQLRNAILDRLREGHFTMVAADPRFADRVRLAYAQDGHAWDRIHVVFADDADAISRISPDEPVLLTRAARKRLGEINLTQIFPYSPTISSETAANLARVMVQLNLGER